MIRINNSDLKRKPGSFMKLLPILIGMFVISVLSLMYISYMNDMDKKEAADQIAREYLLKMESYGFLNLSDEVLLVEELGGLGFKDINLSGTTKLNVGYGKEIILSITANLPVKRYLIDKGVKNETTYSNKLVIKKKTTAKN